MYVSLCVSVLLCLSVCLSVSLSVCAVLMTMPKSCLDIHFYFVNSMAFPLIMYGNSFVVKLLWSVKHLPWIDKMSYDCMAIIMSPAADYYKI